MTKFSSDVLANGGHLESIALDGKDLAGESLSIDIGWFGSTEPNRVFIHSSRDEAGSSIQLAWLEHIGIGTIPADAAIAIVHGLNTADDAQATRRYQLYLATRLMSADHIVVIDVRIGSGGSGSDRLIIGENNLYSGMLPLARVEHATQEFDSPDLLFRDRWRAQVRESGKEIIEDQLARLF